MPPRFALLLAAAGLAAGLGLTNRSAAQPPAGGGGNPSGALYIRYLENTLMAPGSAEVSPFNNIWRANEKSGVLRNWAMWRWVDEDGNVMEEFEFEDVSYDTSWVMDPNDYEVVRDENLKHDGLWVWQDYCTPGVSDTVIHVEAFYMGCKSMGTIWIRD